MSRGGSLSRQRARAGCPLELGSRVNEHPRERVPASSSEPRKHPRGLGKRPSSARRAPVSDCSTTWRRRASRTYLRHRTARLLLVTAVLLVAVAGIAYATIPDEQGVIHGCFKNGSGQLRVVETANACNGRERALDWNQSGPQGPPGPTWGTISGSDPPSNPDEGVSSITRDVPKDGSLFIIGTLGS
jgi:hypothetical protein